MSDGAQAAPHRAIDVQDLGADFYAISGHKMCGPGAGALWGRAELLERMPPFLTGGEMIRKVELERTSWNDLPWKFEAGTPAIAECIAFGTAVEYLQAIGMDAIEAHEHELVAYGYDLLAGIEVGPLAQLAAYRTVQESLANAARHAPGARCEVVVDARDRAHVVVTVRNDPATAPPPTAGVGGGFGIIGMRERVELHEGRLTVESAPGSGTTLVAEVPL